MINTICYFFSFLVEAIILWQYSSDLFPAKRTPQRKLAVLCSLYFILFCVSLFESIWINIILYFFLNLIFLMTQCYLNWYTAVFHSSILTAVMTMSELVVYGITKRFAPHFLIFADFLCRKVRAVSIKNTEPVLIIKRHLVN